MKNHSQIQKKLIFYLDGQLPESERQRVEQHLSGCDECKAYMKELNRTLVLFGENKLQEPGPYFYAGIQNRIQARRTRPVIWSRVLQPVMVVFLLALGIRFGIWVGDQTSFDAASSGQAVLVPFDDLAEEPIEEFLLNLK